MQFMLMQAAADAELTNPLIPNIAEMFVAIVAFAILLFVVVKKVAPAFEKIYVQRSKAIEGGLLEAQRAQQQAAALLDEYNSKLAQSRVEAGEIREKAVREGEKILLDFQQKANSESERIIVLAKKKIAAEHQNALNVLRREVADLALVLAGKVVGEVLSDDERANKVVDRFLVDLETADVNSFVKQDK